MTIEVDNDSEMIHLVSPLDQSKDIDIAPIFNWDALTNVNEYVFELASDEDFTNILESVNVSGNSYVSTVDLEELTVYFWRVRAKSNCGERLSNEYSFETTMISSILEISGVEINIFPNPANEHINLFIGQSGFSELQIQLVNLEGKVIRQNLIAKRETHFQMNIMDIVPGIYFLQFETNGQYAVEKIIVY